MKKKEKSEFFKNGKPKRGYWYKTHITECVLCGAGDEGTRVRIYDQPKPDDPNERYEYSQFVCGIHFV